MKYKGNMRDWVICTIAGIITLILLCIGLEIFKEVWGLCV